MGESYFYCLHSFFLFGFTSLLENMNSYISLHISLIPDIVFFIDIDSINFLLLDTFPTGRIVTVTRATVAPFIIMMVLSLGV